MELGNFENGIEKHADDIRGSIKSSGMYVRHENNFSYTVGFAEIGLPELVVELLPPSHAEELFQTLMVAARRDRQRSVTWLNLGRTLSPEPSFSELADQQRKQVFLDARTGYGHWDFRANLIQLPSRANAQ